MLVCQFYFFEGIPKSHETIHKKPNIFFTAVQGQIFYLGQLSACELAKAQKPKNIREQHTIIRNVTIFEKMDRYEFNVKLAALEM